MNIRCPNCKTLYRVDPARVPARAGRARCVRCTEVFPIADAAANVSPPTVSAAQPIEASVSDALGSARPAEMATVAGAMHPEASPVQVEGPAPAPMQMSAPGPIESSVSAPMAAPAPATEEARMQAPITPPASASTPGVHFFGPQDPNQRARHLARALVSDIVAYYPDRLERSRAAGTLREEFREEILKSWEEYALQVGADFARETDHFQTALNDILARGEQVF